MNVKNKSVFRVGFWARSLIFVMGGFALSALAQGVPSVVPSQDFLRQEQDRLRLEQQRTQPAVRPSGIDLKEVLPEVVTLPESPCKDIQTVTIAGAELMSEQERTALAGRYVGKCLGSAEIQQLMGDITLFYVTRGFVTTRAYLPAQDLRTGQLQVLVQEGRIERIDMSGDDSDRLHWGMAFPGKLGDLLNIRDLEQAIDQLNSAKGNAVTMELLPGSKPGLTVVQMTNRATTPVELSLSTDNMGSESTGRHNASTTLTTGGLLGLNETVSLTWITAVPRKRSAFSESLGASLSIPYGYNTFGLKFSQSQFSIGADIPYRETPFYITGKSESTELTFARVFLRDQSSKHAFTASFADGDSLSYVDGALVKVASQKSKTLSLGVQSSLVVGSGLLTAAPQLVIGQRNHYALPEELLYAAPDANYQKLALMLNYGKGLKWAGENSSWNSFFQGQYAEKSLYSSERISIGGLGSVRGFTDTTLAGDSGFYWRNELALRKGANVMGQAVQWKWYAGYDIGHVSSHDVEEPDGTMTGWVLGLNTQVGPTSLDVSWTRAHVRPTGMPVDRSGQFWFRLSTQF